MNYSAVAIECVHSDSTVISCSGLKLSKNSFMSHGSLVAKALEKHLTDNPILVNEKFDQEIVLQILKKASLKFKVFDKIESCENLSTKVLPHDQVSIDLEKNASTNWIDQSIHAPFKDAHLFHYCFDLELAKELTRLMPSGQGWKLSENESLTFESEAFILSSFVIISTDFEDDVYSIVERMAELSSFPVKGFSIILESSPFGTVCLPMFFNSLSRGIVSNISKSGRLFIADARSIYGCEGAPAYLSSYNGLSLCGFVLSPFCWLRGEWLGLTLLCSSQKVLKSLSSSLKSSRSHYSFTKKGSPTLNISINPFPLTRNGTSLFEYKECINYLTKCLVSIECIENFGNSTRGTGFVVDADLGIIVTCAHVVDKTINKEVFIRDFKGEVQRGNIIFKNNSLENSFLRTNEDVWDVAIIISSHQFSHALPLSHDVPPAGTPSIVGGFGLFNPELWDPFLSFGVISKILKFPSTNFYCEGFKVEFPNKLDKFKNASFWLSNQGIVDIPIYLQSTCDVYEGMSGGPIVTIHPKKGIQAVGVIACSASENTNKVKFPQINLSACSWLLAQLVQGYILSKDKREFDMMHLKSKKPLMSWNKNFKQSKL